MSTFSLADLYELVEEIQEKHDRAIEVAHRCAVQMDLVNARIERYEAQANDPENYEEGGCD